MPKCIRKTYSSHQSPGSNSGAVLHPPNLLRQLSRKLNALARSLAAALGVRYTVFLHSSGVAAKNSPVSNGFYTRSTVNALQNNGFPVSDKKPMSISVTTPPLILMPVEKIVSGTTCTGRRVSLEILIPM